MEWWRRRRRQGPAEAGGESGERAGQGSDGQQRRVSRLLDGNGAPASGRVQPAREAQLLGRRARERRMAGAVGALRVPRVAGVAGIKACSLRRPSDVRSGGASPRDSQDLKSKCWEASSKHWEALLWTHEIRRNFFFESLVKERPSPRFALRGRRLEANRRNMRQRVAVCHIPQAQQQPISLKHTRLRHRTREPEECVPWLIGQALSGAAAGRTRVTGAGRGVASVWYH